MKFNLLFMYSQFSKIVVATVKKTFSFGVSGNDYHKTVIRT